MADNRWPDTHLVPTQPGDLHRQFGNVDFGRAQPAGKKKSSGIGRWVLGIAILAIVISIGQFHTRDKVDHAAVKEGRISAATIK